MSIPFDVAPEVTGKLTCGTLRAGNISENVVLRGWVNRRRDLGGLTTVSWAVLHPFFIATVAVWAALKSGEWRAGAQSYRRRFVKRQWRELWRKLRGGGSIL